MTGTTGRLARRAKAAPTTPGAEIEAKYVVPDATAFEKLQSLTSVGAYRLVARGERRVTDRYLDTLERDLLRGGHSCRRRVDDAGGPEVVTVKGLGAAHGAVHHRAEHEVAIPPGSPPDRWPAIPARDLVMRLAKERPLVELFVVSQQRVVRDVEREGRHIAVLSLDRVEFGAPPTLVSYELEIELAEGGEEADLEALQEGLEPFGLRPQALSKFERGLALLDAAETWAPSSAAKDGGAAPPAPPPAPDARAAKTRARRKPAGTGVSADEPMAEAGRKIMRHHWKLALAHEAGTIAGKDPEELHDMRVATRRQRAALRIVRPHFRGKAIRAVREGLQALGGCLGTVRDLDVLLVAARAYQATLDPNKSRAFQGLIDAWVRRDDAARQQMLAYLHGVQYAEFKELYGRFLDTPGAGTRTDAGEAIPKATRVAHVLPAELWAHYGAVRAYGTVLPGAPVEALHALRIEGKRLRYLLEFFREVLDPCVEKAIGALVAFQDHLGELQDAVVTMGRIREFLSGPDAIATPGVLAAAARYLESRQARIESLRRGLGHPWSRVAGRGFKSCLSRAAASL